MGVGLFDDRLEITSTGSLHFGITPEILFQPHNSRPWNPLVANGFYMRGIIEQWGRGTNKMADLVTAAGLPPPEIEDRAGAVTVRFRPSRYIPPRRTEHALTERQREILLILDGAPDGLPLSGKSWPFWATSTPNAKSGLIWCYCGASNLANLLWGADVPPGGQRVRGN